MSVESNDYSQILTDVMTSAIEARDQTLLNRAVAENANLDRLELEASPEMRLASAAMELADRMVWLYEHRNSRMAKMLGHGVATKLISPIRYDSPDKNSEYEIRTERIFETEPIDTGEGTPVDSYSFSATKYRNHTWTGLRIEEHTVETETGESATHNAWTIRARRDDNDGKITGTDFIHADKEYANKAKQTILADYIEEHPWVALENWESIGIPYDIKSALEIQTNKARMKRARTLHSVLTVSGQERQEVLKDIDWKFLRGQGWDYPEEFYALPYGLVLQATEKLSK